MQQEDAQFIIATHSPILMAIPGAEPLKFNHNPPALIAYDELDHGRLNMEFLSDPEAFLH